MVDTIVWDAWQLAHSDCEAPALQGCGRVVSEGSGQAGRARIQLPKARWWCGNVGLCKRVELVVCAVELSCKITNC
jgi:hypothetical protein